MHFVISRWYRFVICRGTKGKRGKAMRKELKSIVPSSSGRVLSRVRMIIVRPISTWAPRSNPLITRIIKDVYKFSPARRYAAALGNCTPGRGASRISLFSLPRYLSLRAESSLLRLISTYLCSPLALVRREPMRCSHREHRVFTTKYAGSLISRFHCIISSGISSGEDLLRHFSFVALHPSRALNAPDYAYVIMKLRERIALKDYTFPLWCGALLKNRKDR